MRRQPAAAEGGRAGGAQAEEPAGGCDVQALLGSPGCHTAAAEEPRMWLMFVPSFGARGKAKLL